MQNGSLLEPFSFEDWKAHETAADRPQLRVGYVSDPILKLGAYFVEYGIEHPGPDGTLLVLVVAAERLQRVCEELVAELIAILECEPLDLDKLAVGQHVDSAVGGSLWELVQARLGVYLRSHRRGYYRSIVRPV